MGLLTLAVILDVVVTGLLADRLGLASDLYPRWFGARAWLIDGTDPYARTVGDGIQTSMAAALGWDGQSGGGAFAFGFVYPGYVAILLAPLAAIPFPVASTIWLLLAQASIVATTAILWRDFVAPRHVGAIGFVPTVLLAITWPPALFTLIFGQFVALVTACLALSAWLTIRNRTGAAGVALALAFVKPQCAIVPVSVRLLLATYRVLRPTSRLAVRASARTQTHIHWPDAGPQPLDASAQLPEGEAWERRALADRRVLLSAILGGAILVGGSIVLIPGWPIAFVASVSDYATTARATSPAAIIADALRGATASPANCASGTNVALVDADPRACAGGGQTLPDFRHASAPTWERGVDVAAEQSLFTLRTLAVGAIATALVATGWWFGGDPLSSYAVLAAGVLIGAWVIPPIYEWNLITCLFILVPWVQHGSRWRALSWLLANFVTFPLVLVWPDGSRAVWPVLLLGVWLHDRMGSGAPQTPGRPRSLTGLRDRIKAPWRG